MSRIENVPPSLQHQAKQLAEEIKRTQESCPHSFEKVMGKDSTYSPVVGRRCNDWSVIKEFWCPLCNLRKPFRELPYMVCHQCGSEMKKDHTEQYGGERVTIHKCVSCGHEYDTT